MPPHSASASGRRPGQDGRSRGAEYLRPVDDRHARHRRTDADRRRRPVDGFRAAGSARFERLVDDAIASLPPQLLPYLDDVEVSVEPIPPGDLFGAGDQLLLGRYQEGPGQDRRPSAGDRLTLYRRPLEARARNKQELAELVRETVVHEIAHHFGIDDDRLDDLGWG
jgi:predicted Zn-dependent protease with MMP-like domain